MIHFQKIFNPDIYPERLSRLISSIIGTNVTVKYIMSNEDSMLPSTSLLLLDIIVQLEDGSIANVEIQKIHTHFPVSECHAIPQIYYFANIHA